MSYKVVLKYTYKYTSSGNYYKEAVREYYHLIKDVEHNSVFGIGYTPTDKKINLKEVNDNNIKFTYSYGRYLYPNTFRKESELVTKEYVLEQGKDLIIDCVDTYWVYARGGENSPASLEIKWIKYEEFMSIVLSAVEKDKYNASGVAHLLIQEQMYDLAFKILIESNLLSYELGLCYEMGYGTDKDLDKALDIYMNIFAGKHVEKAIERIYKEKYNKEMKYDEVKKTIYFYDKGEYIKAYNNAIIPTVIGDNTLEDMRLNVELNIIKFLELGKPFNDPFSNPSHNTDNLATYFDIVNNYPKQVYYEEWAEDDPYDSGTITKCRYYEKEMLETFQREAKKDDILAIAVLLIQYYEKNANNHELENRLLALTENEKYKGMANYFLGLYYNYLAKENKKIQDYDYTEIVSIAFNYFEKAFKNDFYLALPHIAEKYLNDNIMTIEEMAKYKKYIPYIRYSMTEKYYDLIK